MCAECGHMFTRLGHLRRHTRLHTGDKPFMCNRCACQFARADHLRRHLQAHHPDDPALHPKDPNLLSDVKLELDGLPTSDDPSLVSVPDESGTDEIGMPVFLGPIAERSGSMSRKSGQRDADPVPASGDNLSSFTMSTGVVDETRTADLLPPFPGHGVEKSISELNRSNYQAVDISEELPSTQLDGGKSVGSRDEGRTTASTVGSAVYEAGTLTSLPVFSGHRDGKSRTHFAAVEIPAELKADGRKSAAADDCDHVTTVAARFHESSNSPTVSVPEHRNFPMSGNSAAFRADFWHRSSPASYVNDRLLLAGAANLRHFDAGFSSRSPESSPTNLAHRYSQVRPPMPGSFLGGVVDFRRLPPENPAVTSQQTDSTIPDASPLSLARYQHK